LSKKEKEFLVFILNNHLYEFTPIDVSKMLGVSNKTIINRCAKLTSNGFLVPVIVKDRIRSYRISDFTKANKELIIGKTK
jgi:Fic family protein